MMILPHTNKKKEKKWKFFSLSFVWALTFLGKKRINHTYTLENLSERQKTRKEKNS